jgi:hypothetical protein
MATCVYEGCDRMATDHDCDGDEACALHAAQSERYTIAVDRSADWLAPEHYDALAVALSAEGWDVCVRDPRRDEAPGTYRHDARGLQILGYALPEPEALRSAVDAAWQRVVC